ncbi:MAG: phosphoribosyltransferase [Acidimicrobiales bacterium]
MPDPRIVADASAIDDAIRQMAVALSATHTHGDVVVGVLKGGVLTTADLVRRLDFCPAVDFVALARYGSAERAHLVKDLDLDVTGARVVIIEDVVDTGLSLAWLVGEIARRDPASITTCALVDKPLHRVVPVELDHVGLTVEHDFLLGYGLDFAGRYRNLGLLAAADLEALRADPDCYQRWATRMRREQGRGPAG